MGDEPKSQKVADNESLMVFGSSRPSSVIRAASLALAQETECLHLISQEQRKAVISAQ